MSLTKKRNRKKKLPQHPKGSYVDVTDPNAPIVAPCPAESYCPGGSQLTPIPCASGTGTLGSPGTSSADQCVPQDPCVPDPNTCCRGPSTQPGWPQYGPYYCEGVGGLCTNTAVDKNVREGGVFGFIFFSATRRNEDSAVVSLSFPFFSLQIIHLELRFVRRLVRQRPCGRLLLRKLRQPPNIQRKLRRLWSDVPRGQHVPGLNLHLPSRNDVLGRRQVVPGPSREDGQPGRHGRHVPERRVVSWLDEKGKGERIETSFRLGVFFLSVSLIVLKIALFSPPLPPPRLPLSPSLLPHYHPLNSSLSRLLSLIIGAPAASTAHRAAPRQTPVARA